MKSAHAAGTGSNAPQTVAVALALSPSVLGHRQRRFAHRGHSAFDHPRGRARPVLAARVARSNQASRTIEELARLYGPLAEDVPVVLYAFRMQRTAQVQAAKTSGTSRGQAWRYTLVVLIEAWPRACCTSTKDRPASRLSEA